MKRLILHIILLSCLLVGYAETNAQAVDSLRARTIMLRDSLDFLDKKLSINTSSNEFSPIPYQGGLMYISNKPIEGAKVVFNKLYWTADPTFKIIDRQDQVATKGVTITKTVVKGKTDDFTAPTSNDNDILFRYKKFRKRWNKVEQTFSNFSTDQAFAYDETANILIYAKQSNKLVKGKRHWALWQSALINGRLKQKKRLLFDDKECDYLYPFIAKNNSRLYFASNKKGSIGGYDIYYVDRVGNNWSRIPIHLDSNINTKFDEIAPALISDSIYFSSNRTGGLGGFDIYQASLNKTTVIKNAGYPLNSDKDEVSLKKVLNQYYLSTNRAGDFDVLGVDYLPMIYPIQGLLTYKSDGSLVPNHVLYLKDKVLNQIIDTIKTNDLAQYNFKGKPNRNYEFITINGDSTLEAIPYATYPDQKNFNNAISIKGRSPKQRADSLHALWVYKEQIRLDSLATSSLATKFIVHYGFNKSTIQSKEQLVLDSLLNKLQKMPTSYIVVGAFTDCIGSYKYNYQLSVKRAKAVVNYLIKHGLDKNRIVSNGYSKKYNVTPCTTKYTKNSKQVQKDNRRAEIVLSDIKKTDWATLEAKRGTNYYTVYNGSSKIAPIVPKVVAKVIRPIVKKDTTVKVITPIIVKKKDTVVVAKVTPVVIKKDTIIMVKKDTVAKILKPMIKKDAIVKVIAPVIVKKKDTVVVAKVTPVVIKKDTVAKLIKAIVKKDTVIVAKVIPVVKKDTVTKIKKDTVAKVDKPIIKKDTVVKVVKPISVVKKDTIVKVIAPVIVKKKDTVVVAKVTPVVIKKDTVAKFIKAIVKKDTVIVAKVTSVVKKDTVIKVKKDTVAKIIKPLVKKDTVFKLIAPVVVKKDTVAKVVKPLPLIVKKKDTVLEAKVSSVVKKEKVLVASNANYEDDELSKAEIIKALDSLAKLKREQERIIEYLTKRINKKPIDIYVGSDSVTIEIYDNAIHDKDSVSIIYNNRIIVDRQELKVNKPIKFKLKVEKNKKFNELVMVAENLGSEPPNTAVLFVTEKSGRRQQVMLSTDMTHNEVIYFIRIGKE